MDNPRIARKKADIARAEEKIAELRDKLREQKLELTALENDEIIAMYRKENFSEDEFFALLRSQRKAQREAAASPGIALKGAAGQEDERDADTI